MSYCRFQNTLRDLRDCAEHLHEKDLSEEEEKARKQLVVVCKSITQEDGEA